MILSPMMAEALTNNCIEPNIQDLADNLLNQEFDIQPTKHDVVVLLLDLDPTNDILKLVSNIDNINDLEDDEYFIAKEKASRFLMGIMEILTPREILEGICRRKTDKLWEIIKILSRDNQKVSKRRKFMNHFTIDYFNYYGGEGKPYHKNYEIQSAITNDITFTAIAEDDEVMTMKEFIDDIKSHNLIDYDGHGYFAKEDNVSNIKVIPSDYLFKGFPDWATHVVWYNK